jgi:beta-glucuronidase
MSTIQERHFVSLRKILIGLLWWYNKIYRYFQVPTNYIRSYSLKLVPDGCFNKIEFKAAINCQHLEINSAILVSIEGLGSFSFPVDKSSGSISSVIEAEPELWCPDVPKLYNCEIRLGDHVLRDSIGFREVKVNGNKICLNGKPVFLKGICVHEESCSNHRSVTDDDIIQTINDAKDLGCNFVRLTHYPHTDRFAEIADQMGIMLWEEIPVYWTIDFKNAITKSDAINQLEELIVRDINRASVIIWSVGNETPNTSERLAFMRSLITTARQKDNSRLITASCLIDLDEMVVQDPLIDYLDVIGLNEYYGWYIRDFNKLKKILANTTVDKPLIISETGADAVANKHGGIEELYTEECQANIYRKQFEIIDQTEYICGVSPWILYDYASMRRMSNLQNGFNIKGLITFDRKYKKQAYNVVQNYYRTK